MDLSAIFSPYLPFMRGTFPQVTKLRIWLYHRLYRMQNHWKWSHVKLLMLNLLTISPSFK